MKIFALLFINAALAGCASMYLPDYSDKTADQAKAMAADNKVFANCTMGPTPWGMTRTTTAVADETGQSNVTVAVKGDCAEVTIITNKPQKPEPVKP